MSLAMLNCESCGVATDAIRCDVCEAKRRDAFWTAMGEADLRSAFSQPPCPPTGSIAARADHAGRLVGQLSFAVHMAGRTKVANVLRGFSDRLQADIWRDGVGLLNIANVGRQAYDYIRARAWFTTDPITWPPVEGVAAACWELACYAAVEHLNGAAESAEAP